MSDQNEAHAQVLDERAKFARDLEEMASRHNGPNPHRQSERLKEAAAYEAGAAALRAAGTTPAQCDFLAFAAGRAYVRVVDDDTLAHERWEMWPARPDTTQQAYQTWVDAGRPYPMQTTGPYAPSAPSVTPVCSCGNYRTFHDGDGHCLVHACDCIEHKPSDPSVTTTSDEEQPPSVDTTRQAILDALIKHGVIGARQAVDRLILAVRQEKAGWQETQCNSHINIGSTSYLCTLARGHAGLCQRPALDRLTGRAVPSSPAEPVETPAQVKALTYCDQCGHGHACVAPDLRADRERPKARTMEFFATKFTGLGAGRAGDCRVVVRTDRKRLQQYVQIIDDDCTGVGFTPREVPALIEALTAALKLVTGPSFPAEPAE